VSAEANTSLALDQR